MVDLSREQIEDLLLYIGVEPTFWRGTDMSILCPVHHESNPSCGVSVEKQIYHCFSCGSAGDFGWLLHKSLPDDFKNHKDAWDFLIDRYELEVSTLSDKAKSIRRYEDVPELKKTIKVIPRYKIAPFQSGKETYSYYFERGFNERAMVEFEIGRDLENKTVTIPIYNEEHQLVGIIGRYISKNRKKNERYKIYDFSRGSTLYLIDRYEPIDDTMILVEGTFDAQKMHMIGYTNCTASMSDNLTAQQVKLICRHCKTVIMMSDNDERGLEAREANYKLLRDKVNVKYVQYPSYGKDPCDWKDHDIDTMIENVIPPYFSKIKMIY